MRLRWAWAQGAGGDCVTLLVTLTGLSLVHGQVAETQTNYTCTRRCTVDDVTAACWRQSAGFYTKQLTSAVQEYAAVLTHIARWSSHGKGRSHHHAIARKIMAAVIGATEREETLEPLPASDLLAIFELILNKTAPLEEHYSDPSVIPVTHMCPIPCDFYPRVWMSLFFVTLAGLLLLAITLCLYLAQQQLRTEQRPKYS